MKSYILEQLNLEGVGSLFGREFVLVNWWAYILGAYIQDFTV